MIQKIFSLKYQFAFFGWTSIAFISFDRISCFASFKWVIIAQKQNSDKGTDYLLSAKDHELLRNSVVVAGKFAFCKMQTDQRPIRTDQEPTRNEPESFKKRPGNEQSIVPNHSNAWFVYILYKNKGGRQYIIFAYRPVSCCFHQPVQVRYHNEQPCTNIPKFKSAREFGSGWSLYDSGWFLLGFFVGFWWVLVDSHFTYDIENYVNSRVSYC